MKRILSLTRKAVEDFKMIEEGDKIAVGVSAGKDSLTLLVALANLKNFYPKKFELEALTIDMGFEDFNLEPVRIFCNDLKVPYTVRKTNIKEIVFDVRNESNPCSLCARLRRGALNELALEKKCNKVALGHHMDDLIETFFLSLFYEGRIHTFSPVTHLDRTDLRQIRPFVYMEEKNIKSFAVKNSLPVCKSTCPNLGKSKRQYIKQYIKDLSKTHKNIKNLVLGAIKRSKIDGYNI